MEELDFSKIFGETATSKASFTDENYLNGWGYLGSTPPPYQLFDYLQSKNDKKAKYLYDKTIENDNKLALHNTNATAHTDIRAKITSDINSHNSNTSAHTDIRAKITSDINSHNTNATAHTAILNAIKAISGMSAYDIAPSKTIAAIIPLLGQGAIIASKLSGTDGFVKFANGFIIQWGYYSNVVTGTQINFPIAFTTRNVAVTTNGRENSNRDAIQYFSVHSVTNTGFKVLSKRFDNSITNDYGTFIAMGY